MADQTCQFSFLKIIEPPKNFPATSFDICFQIQSKFYNECIHFLKSQKKLYECSKKVQNQLQNAIKQTVSLGQWIRAKTATNQKIMRELNKINHQYVQAEERQEFLSSVCKFINMDEARNVLLSVKIQNQEQFVSKLNQIDALLQQISGIKSNAKVITQIRQQLVSLLEQTVTKLFKTNISNSLLMKLTSNASGFFLKEKKIENIFTSSLSHHRLNFFKVSLNPLINNINYVQNVTQLYEAIVQEWIKMLDQQLSIFFREEVPELLKEIPKQVMTKYTTETIPKMERGIYKLKNLVEISRIRHSFMKLKAKLQECGESSWESISKLLLKIYILLQQNLQSGAQQIEIAKYNIYSLVSYVPIRQYLQLIKQAKIYDPKNAQINWQRGFKRLVDSRDPSKQPNNKSLIIFNLNIWFLYSHIMKQEGQMKEKAQSMIKEGVNAIINLNLSALKKEYEQKNIQKLLDLCSDYQLAIKNLHAEINLLHHEKLRQTVQVQLNSRFLQQIYEPMLKINNVESGLQNSQIISLAKKQKINLNKYGKNSQKIKILAVNEMAELLR